MTSTKLRILAIASAVVVSTLGSAVVEAGGGVTGSIKFEGKKPKMRRIRMKSEPTCNAHHGDTKVREERVVVNENGTLKNIFVHVKSGLPAGKTYDAPAEPVTLNQVGCQYDPHVIGLQVNQPLKIVNSDTGVLHNIHSFGQPGNAFNVGQPGNGMELTQKFVKPEVMVRVKCDVHGWMSSYVGVVDHPFYAITGDAGDFTIADLPAGDYEIEAWSEEFGTQSQKVTVTEGGSAETSFTFKGE